MGLDLSFLQNIASVCNKRLAELNISEISPGSFQPRREIPEEELAALSKSIAGSGVLQPPLVRKVEGGYELICGERRLRAAAMAGLTSIPCLIAELDDRQAALAALTENLQRRDLNCFEQAEAYSELLRRFGLTQSALAVMLGISQPAIGNKLRLLGLAPELRDKLTSAGLGERHARALLAAEPGSRSALLDKAISGSLTAEQLEALIAETAREQKRRRSYRRRAAALSDTRLFFNTVEKAVKVMRLSGVAAETERKEADGFIEYVIRIPQVKG